MYLMEYDFHKSIIVYFNSLKPCLVAYLASKKIQFEDALQIG